MLCSEHGGPLPSSNNISTAYSDVFTGASTPIFQTLDWVKSYSSTESTCEYVGKKYHSPEVAYYAKKATNICTPKAAYVLNAMQEGVNSYGAPGNYTAIQQAWYNTVDGGSNTTTLYEQASAYQGFVKKIAKQEDDVSKPSTYVSKSHKFGDKTVSIKFPEINADKINSMLSFNHGEAKVNYNEQTQKYVIGPFSINYIEASSGDVQFGAIEGMDIYTDASKDILPKDKWRFVWTQENRKESEYPHNDETFYIEMDYIENATMITGIDVDYKYLIAGAEYQTLEGTYDQYVWEVKCDTTEVTDDDGNTQTNYNWYFHNSQKILAKEAQKLALANKAARWYETTKIHTTAKQGNLKIVKKAIDENGNEMTADQIKDKFGKDQYFDFKVTVTHSNGKVENDVVTVRAGSSVTKNYTWIGEEEAPTFTVEEVPITNNTWQIKSIDPKNGTLRNGETITVTAVNQIEESERNEGKIELTKTLSGPASEIEEFSFEVIVTRPNGKIEKDNVLITVPKGQITGNKWSKIYQWDGAENAHYQIIEKETEASKKYNSIITPKEGEIGKKLKPVLAEVKVNATNNEIDTKDKIGYLTIEKKIKDDKPTEDSFIFNVHIDGNIINEANRDFTVSLKAGEKYKTEYLWKAEDPAPTFTVKELDSDEVQNINMEISGAAEGTADTSTKGIAKGQLVADGEANVKAIFVNDMKEHKGGIKVIKDIETTEKISKETLEKDGTKFDIEVVIEGTFVHNGKTYQNTTEVITKTLPDNGNWEFEVKDVVWYGSKAPTFTVTEKNLPKGWKCKTISYSDLADKDTSSEGHKLIDDKTIETKIVNELPSETVIDLTFSMAGLVWVDQTLDGKNTADDGYYLAPNGVYDEGELLKENAEVNVYRVVYQNGTEVARTLAKAYKDKDDNELAFPIVTKSDGKWNVPRISVPALTDDEKAKGYTSVSYDVEFAYDGQTYEPTEFLSYQIKKNGEKIKNQGSNADKANEYRNAKTSVKDRYAKDSMALEATNNAKKITEVSGKTEMNANGDTTGVVTVDGNSHEITYSSDNAGTGYPTISKVNTVDNNGKVLDIFRATATTSKGNLTFPFDVDGYNGSSLTDINTTLTENGVVHEYKFIAVYNYCLNINLGLKERATADIGLTKKLDNAKVIVKEKLYQYNYSGNYDLTEEKVSSLDKNIKVDNASVADEIQYTLGLYRSDYYYRAQMYKNGEDTSMYDRLENFYKTLGKTAEDTEMDIYLTYKIKLMNNSSAYDVVINSLDDYYDSSFTLVRENESKYLKTQTVAKVETAVNAETEVAKASDYADKWVDVKTGIAGSDKDGNGNHIVYNKMTANGLGIKLAPAETKEILLTFKLNKKDNDNAKNAIVLGQKCNVAEIASYSTFDTGTNNNAGKIDRDSAASNVNITSHNEKAWYEDDTFAAPRINVNFVEEGKDRTINGIAWEDNSKDENTENPGYNQQVGNGIKDSGEDVIKDLTTELVEKVMVPNQDGTYIEYDYIWPTDQKMEQLNGKSLEEVINFDSTITTSDKGEYTFKNAPAGDYVVRFTYGDKKEMKSADYSTAEYYNGQDYKSARFKGILKDGTQIQADSYLNIDQTNANADHNTAVDSEARRLQVIANSREIMYKNGAVMGEYQDKLFSDYYMWADTPKLDINLEMSNYDENNKENYKYDVNNVNFGLEERPSTELTLDKQIEEIKLTTSDGNAIMDAKYSINYEVADNGKITAKVELDTRNSYGIDNLQALNRDLATNQGFRYINVDSTILEGTTITVKYRFTVLNTGEVDRTGKLATMDYKDDKTAFDTARNELTTALATYTKLGNDLKNDKAQGEYVGSIYYYGAEGDQNDWVVTSTVRQLVDYIDNDVSFSGMLNATTDTSWSNITASELKELIKADIIQTQDGKDVVLDEKGIQYETENRNNLVVSVDSTESTLNNGGFIVELVPYQATQGDKAVTDKEYQASMYLTTTRYVGSDSDDLQIDNIAEIIKFNNKVGRRDELSIPGNVDPAKALETHISMTTPTTLSAGMLYERDTSATEVITLSPPTGTGLMTWKLQVAASVTTGLAIIAGGIVFIKKKILK